jgi:uncharacterized BrkB/YihY/UPF0761 family membrane protein
MVSFVIYFVAALILFLIFVGVIALAVVLGITFAKAKENKNQAIEETDNEQSEA